MCHVYSYARGLQMLSFGLDDSTSKVQENIHIHDNILKRVKCVPKEPWVLPSVPCCTLDYTGSLNENCNSSYLEKDAACKCGQGKDLSSIGGGNCTDDTGDATSDSE